jgi:SAM-dependent methyltransferase
VLLEPGGSAWATAGRVVAETGHEIADKPFIALGVIAFAALAPLAATSSAAMIRRLGGKRWRRLHRLVFVAAGAGVLHHWWPLAIVSTPTHSVWPSRSSRRSDSHGGGATARPRRVRRYTAPDDPLCRQPLYPASCGPSSARSISICSTSCCADDSTTAAGCGDGRNLAYLLRCGLECLGVDADPVAIARMRERARRIASSAPPSRFQVADLARLPYRSGCMDAVICSAVLHFARDEAHWRDMVDEMWRVLAPGGLLFARLASTIGLQRLAGSEPGRVRLPDGTERFVVTERFLLDSTRRLGGRLLDPIKTTNVQEMRAMTTWVAEK